MAHEAGQTFEDHLLELAEFAGTLDADGGLPSNAYELGKLKRKYNHGLKLLAAMNPRGWNVLVRPIELTLSADGSTAILDNEGAADSSRILLPPGVIGAPLDNIWTWISAEGNETGEADATNYQRVTRLLEDVEVTGAPRYVSVMPRTSADEEGQEIVQFEARVAPRPDRDYRMVATFQLSVVRLVELGQRHPFGERLDTAVLAAAKWALVMDDKEDPRRKDKEADFLAQAALAIAHDAQLAPSNLGELTDPGVHRAQSGFRRDTISDLTLNGVRVNP